jgi:hypothetical protein
MLNNVRSVVFKKVFGIYRKPVNTNLQFVDDYICIFLISNYLAIQDIENDITEYVEISNNVFDPTAMFSIK